MKIYSIIIITGCCLFAAACGGMTVLPAPNNNSNTTAKANTPANTTATTPTATPLAPPVAVEFAKACSVENNHKNVEIVGYLDNGDGGVVQSCGDMGTYKSCMYRLRENAADKKGIKTNITQGSSANQAEGMPTSEKDTKIHLTDGSLLDPKNKVKVTAEMSVSSDGTWCDMKVSKIEKQ